MLRKVGKLQIRRKGDKIFFLSPLMVESGRRSKPPSCLPRLSLLPPHLPQILKHPHHQNFSLMNRPPVLYLHLHSRLHLHPHPHLDLHPHLNLHPRPHLNLHSHPHLRPHPCLPLVQSRLCFLHLFLHCLSLRTHPYHLLDVAVVETFSSWQLWKAI